MLLVVCWHSPRAVDHSRGTHSPPAQGGIQILEKVDVVYVLVTMLHKFQQFFEFPVPPVQFLYRVWDIRVTPQRQIRTVHFLVWLLTRPLLYNDRCSGFDVPVTSSDWFQQFVTNRAENCRFSTGAVPGQGSCSARQGASSGLMFQAVLNTVWRCRC